MMLGMGIGTGMLGHEDEIRWDMKVEIRWDVEMEIGWDVEMNVDFDTDVRVEMEMKMVATGMWIRFRVIGGILTSSTLLGHTHDYAYALSITPRTSHITPRISHRTPHIISPPTSQRTPHAYCSVAHQI